MTRGERGVARREKQQEQGKQDDSEEDEMRKRAGKQGKRIMEKDERSSQSHDQILEPMRVVCPESS